VILPPSAAPPTIIKTTAKRPIIKGQIISKRFFGGIGGAFGLGGIRVSGVTEDEPTDDTEDTEDTNGGDVGRGGSIVGSACTFNGDC